MSDSPWAVVAGAAKSIGVTIHEAIYGMSFANLILYGAAIPTYGDEEEAGEIDAGRAGNEKQVLDFFNR